MTSASETVSMYGEIGEFHEMSGKMQGEWCIADFFSLPEEGDSVYTSPKFLFGDACWCFRIYPNGESRMESEGYIGLYLIRKDCGRPITLRCSFGIRRADGGENIHGNLQNPTFLQTGLGYGFSKFLKRSDLLIRGSDVAPLDALTLTFTLNSERRYSENGSLFGRLWNASQSLREILKSRKRSDVVLKLKDGEIPAHKVILQARSPVFNRMFDVDMRESQTGEVIVKDANKSAFDVVLNYAYCGVPNGLSSENMHVVFKISHKYEMEELTKFCKDFMQESLSLDTVCDVIVVAETYQEKELKGRAKYYFVNNVAEIVETEKWKALKIENLAIVSELLECIIVENASKIKI